LTDDSEVKRDRLAGCVRERLDLHQLAVAPFQRFAGIDVVRADLIRYAGTGRDGATSWTPWLVGGYLCRRTAI
jgi:hypothetical protein